MKKAIVFCVLICTFAAASAQFHADIRVGATASTFGDEHIKMGVRAGVGFDYLFNKHWGLRTGLSFAMKGATKSNNVFNYSSEKATKLSYLDLPVEVLVSFRLSPKSSLALHGGPYVACLLHSSVPQDSGLKIHRFDTGVGCGLDFAVGHFIIGPDVQYGLTKLAKSGSNHNITYSLTLGCRF